jgi:condensin complex subunit 1
MAVDEDEQEDQDSGEQDEQDEQDEPASMFIDEEEDADGNPCTPKKKKKSKKAKKEASSRTQPRKSELDMAALSNEQAALAALEGNQILHLRLRKKYYVEALNFIRQIEGAMEIIAQLLGSTNKAEVLEAMEFFRVAYEYQFESAEVGCVSVSVVEMCAG